MFAHRPSPLTLRHGVRALAWFLGVAVLLSQTEMVQAQNYPRLKLERVTPPGAKTGTAVEVVIDGDYLDDVKSLYFSDARLKAELVPPPAPDPKVKNPPTPPLKFKITIPADMPVGNYDVRAIGKWGMSNPRAFAVGDQKEEMEKEPNNDVPQAQKIELNSTINGAISANTDVDFTVFTGKKGQRVLVICDASTIDSKLNPQLDVYTFKGGQRLTGNRNYFDRNAVVDVILPEDGDYLVRLCSFAYQYGNPAAFYRLTVTTAPWIDAVYPPAIEKGKVMSLTLLGRNLPGGKLEPGLAYEGRPLEKAVVPIDSAKMPANLLEFKGLLLPGASFLDGFEFRVKNAAGSSNPALVTYSSFPVVLDNEKNDSMEQAQKVALPCTLCGALEKENDQDYYSFTAKKGDSFTFECFGDRIGGSMRFFLQLRQMNAKDNPIVATFNSHSELPDPNAGGFAFETDDPKGKYAIPADGDYQLLVGSDNTHMFNGPRFVYRVNIHKEQPDFRLVLVENETDNGGSFTVHKGGCQELTVVVIRQDGFDGEVLLEAEGLPAGVVCPPQMIGPKIKKGVLVVQATDSAAEFSGTFKVKGTAVLDGKPVVRPAQAACLVWPVPPQQQIPAQSRMTKSLCMAVRDKGPFALETEVKDLAVPVGGNVDVKVKVKRVGDFKAQVQLVRLSAPVLSNGQLINVPNVNIEPNKGEAVVKITVPNNTQPGTYNLVFQGKAKYNVEDPKDSKKKKNSDVYEASPPIKVVVFDKIAEVTVPNPKATVKAGDNIEVPIKVNRLFDYKGEYEVTLTVPGGVAGVTSDKIKIAAGATDGKLLIKTAKNATVSANPNYVVKVTGKVGTLTFNSEAKFELNITKATAALPPAVTDPVARLPALPASLPVAIVSKGDR